MLVLNDDCLYLVFRGLTFAEQLVATQVCERFRDVIVYNNWRNKKFHTYNTNNDDTYLLRQPEYKMFFDAVTDVIESFTILGTPHGYFPGPIAADEMTFYGTFKFSRLREVECMRDRIADVHMGYWARNWCALEVLRIRSNYISGIHINQMYNLTSLCVAKCNLRQHYLTLILSGNQLLHLNHLDISGHPRPDAIKDAFELADPEGLLCLKHFVLSWNAIGREFVRFMGSKMRDLQILRVVGPFRHKVQIINNRTLRIMNFHWLQFAEALSSTIEELRFYNFTMRQDLQFPFDTSCFQRFTGLRTFHANYELLFSIDPALLTKRSVRELHLNYLEDIRNVLELIRVSSVLEHIYISRLLQVWPDVLNLVRSIIEILRAQRTRRYPLTIHAPRITNEIFESTYYREQSVLVLVAERIEEQRSDESFIEIRFVSQNDDSDSGVVS